MKILKNPLPMPLRKYLPSPKVVSRELVKLMRVNKRQILLFYCLDETGYHEFLNKLNLELKRRVQECIETDYVEKCSDVSLNAFVFENRYCRCVIVFQF